MTPETKPLSRDLTTAEPAEIDALMAQMHQCLDLARNIMSGGEKITEDDDVVIYALDADRVRSLIPMPISDAQIAVLIETINDIGEREGFTTCGISAFAHKLHHLLFDPATAKKLDEGSAFMDYLKELLGDKPAD